MQALRALTITLAALASTGAAASVCEAADEVRLALRVVSLKASGKRAPGDQPRADPSARPYLPALQRLGYDHYRGAKGEVLRAEAGQALTFSKSLPLDLRARFEWSAGERIQLEFLIDRPAPEEGQRVKVLKGRVETSDGQHFVIRVEQAFPDGDLILLVTAQRETG